MENNNAKKQRTRTFSTNGEIDGMISEMVAAGVAPSVSALVRAAIEFRYQQFKKSTQQSDAIMFGAIEG